MKIKILICGLMLALVGCANNKTSDSSGTTTTTTAGYSLVNGYCYNTSGQMVANTYCTSTGYYMNGAYCYSSSGQVVATSYCSATTTTTTNTGYGSCVGQYYYYTGYAWQLVSCNGVNCRGYTLYTTAGQPTYCQ